MLRHIKSKYLMDLANPVDVRRAGDTLEPTDTDAAYKETRVLLNTESYP